MAEWLYNSIKKNTNILMNIDIINVAFLLCCKSFNIEMAKWLYDLLKNDLKIEIDVTIDDDYALLLACNGNQIEMVELLCSLNKNYSYTKNNSGNLIPKIRNLRNDLKEIYDKFFSDDIFRFKLEEFYKNAEMYKINDKICPICLSDEEIYQIKLHCNHTVCSTCFTYGYNNNKCHYKCNGYIKSNSIKLIKVE